MSIKKDFEIQTVPSMIESLFDDIEHGILSPLLHLKEFDNHWMLEFDLPLVNKKDIKITFDGNVLNIEAKLQKKYSEEKHGKTMTFQYFKKSISIPGEIDNEKITAKFQKGRLVIKILKKIIGKSIKIS